MAGKRKRGEGTVRLRKDGRWAEFDYLGRRLTEFGTNND